MTEQDIIDMAKETGLFYGDKLTEDYAYKVKRFARLVANAKTEQIATSCERLPFGDTAHSFAIWIRKQ
jgi:hypothetical protein